MKTLTTEELVNRMRPLVTGWEVTDAQDVDGARKLHAEIERAPEAHETDSNRPDYYAMRALNPLAYAAEVLTADDPLLRVQWSSRAATSLLRDLDFHVAGRLHEAEIQEQARVVEWLSAPGARIEIQKAMEAADQSDVSTLLPDLVQRVEIARGWTSHALG